MATQFKRRTFTVDEYHKMGEAGILGEDHRVELIDGEVVQMSPINVPPAFCVDRLTMLLAQQVPTGVIVRVQNPILIDELNEPQPDLAVLRPRDSMQLREHPGPGDILLLIEVADSTVGSDRFMKVPLYARAGIREVWLVNIRKGQIEVYSDAAGGKYRNVKSAGKGEILTPEALPEVIVPIGQLFSE